VNTLSNVKRGSRELSPHHRDLAQCPGGRAPPPPPAAPGAAVGRGVGVGAIGQGEGEGEGASERERERKTRRDSERGKGEGEALMKMVTRMMQAHMMLCIKGYILCTYIYSEKSVNEEKT
jgi:hypothetical protein